MARDYCKVLQALGTSFTVIGRGAASASDFKKATGVTARTGGVFDVLKKDSAADAAIIAVDVDQLSNTAEALMNAGTKIILLEKPGGLNLEQIQRLNEVAINKDATVWIAYNRRFYASTLTAEELLAEDGGATSVLFEFTEWSHQIRDLPLHHSVKEHWFLANSTHVVDLAFHLCGVPAIWKYWLTGSLEWHPAASRFCGSGVTDHGVLFSYLSDWEAPGRWGLEVLTRKRRFILRPMEKLQVTMLGSVKTEPVKIDDQLDRDFKPGLYRQTAAFLAREGGRFCSLVQQAEHADLYSRMGGYQL